MYLWPKGLQEAQSKSASVLFVIRGCVSRAPFLLAYPDNFVFSLYLFDFSEYGRAAYRIKAPPDYDLEPDRTFTTLVDGIDYTVTCPENAAADFVYFRPFDSYRFLRVTFRTSRHGLLLEKLPGQQCLQLVDVAEGSEGSGNKVVVALSNKKYFLRVIGETPAPNSVKSALEQIANSRFPLDLVFGPPGPPEDVSPEDLASACPTSEESSGPPPTTPSTEETASSGHAKSRNASHATDRNGGVEMHSGSYASNPLSSPRRSGSYTVQFHERTIGMTLRAPNWIVSRIDEGTEAASKPMSIGDRVIAIDNCTIGVNTKKNVDVLRLIREARRPTTITFCRPATEHHDGNDNAANDNDEGAEGPDDAEDPDAGDGALREPAEGDNGANSDNGTDARGGNPATTNEG